MFVLVIQACVVLLFVEIADVIQTVRGFFVWLGRSGWVGCRGWVGGHWMHQLRGLRAYLWDTSCINQTNARDCAGD